MTGIVLIVDDYEYNLKLLEAKLLSEYYTVICAKDGLEALEIIRAKKIDVILLDIMMPKMNGYEVCDLIKGDRSISFIPIIIITALNETSDRIKGLESGADEFLTKPINDVALFARVKSLIKTKHLFDELLLRNRTNQYLGLDTINFTDNFKINNVIIIDDDFVQASNICDMIWSSNIKCNICNNYNEIYGLGIIPDIIIINASMQHYDPLRICVNIRNKVEYKNIPLLMITEQENINIVVKGVELGVNDYFIYPVTKNELLARIKTQIKRRHYQDSLENNLTSSLNLSVKDSLTCVYNRRYFDAYLNQMIQSAKYNNESLMLMMIDVDFFKKINDNYGHLVGDSILRKVAVIIHESAGITDFAARYGGEEFALVVHDIQVNNALSIANKLKDKIEHTNFTTAEKNISVKITVSIGISTLGKNQSLEELILNADKALYTAKNFGRNKIIFNTNDL